MRRPSRKHSIALPDQDAHMHAHAHARTYDAASQMHTVRCIMTRTAQRRQRRQRTVLWVQQIIPKRVCPACPHQTGHSSVAHRHPPHPHEQHNASNNMQCSRQQWTAIVPSQNRSCSATWGLTTTQVESCVGIATYAPRLKPLHEVWPIPQERIPIATKQPSKPRKQART